MSLTHPRLEPDAGPAAPSRGDARPPAGVGARLMVGGAVAVAGALAAAAVMLWERHGATVFFDILSAGIAACL